MKKTGQLIFVSKEGEDVVQKAGVSYLYYLEILVDKSCRFNIDGLIIEAFADKTLYIRTPVKSVVVLTQGVNINIIYETGDSNSFGDIALKQFIGNGTLSTNSQTIVGAINEIYSRPEDSYSDTPTIIPEVSFSFPNQETLLKIDEPKFQEWNEYEDRIKEVQVATSYLKSELEQIKDNPATTPGGDTSALEGKISTIELRANSALNAAQQAYDLTQRLNTNVMSLSERYKRLYVNNGSLTLEANKYIAIMNVSGTSPNLQIQPLTKGLPYDTGFTINPTKNLTLTFPTGYTFYWSGPKITSIEVGKFYKYDIVFDGQIVFGVKCTVYEP